MYSGLYSIVGKVLEVEEDYPGYKVMGSALIAAGAAKYMYFADKEYYLSARYVKVVVDKQIYVKLLSTDGYSSMSKAVGMVVKAEKAEYHYVIRKEDLVEAGANHKCFLGHTYMFSPESVKEVEKPKEVEEPKYCKILETAYTGMDSLINKPIEYKMVNGKVKISGRTLIEAGAEACFFDESFMYTFRSNCVEFKDTKDEMSPSDVTDNIGKFIVHTKRNSLYKLNGLVQVDTTKGWVEHMTYTDLNTGKTYARVLTEFKNFRIV